MSRCDTVVNRTVPKLVSLGSIHDGAPFLMPDRAGVLYRWCFCMDKGGVRVMQISPGRGARMLTLSSEVKVYEAQVDIGARAL